MPRTDLQLIDGKWQVVMRSKKIEAHVDKAPKYIAVAGRNYEVFETLSSACAYSNEPQVYEITYYLRITSEGEEEILPISKRVR